MTSSPAGLTVLDCTLRDGGYYNSWDFHPELVAEYFQAVQAAKVDVVELGFRMPAASEFLGPFAYTSDAFLSGVDLPKGPELAVMCNASDLVEDPVGSIDALFRSKDDSPIDFVRIAAHFREVERTRPAVERLRELGYRVGFNLMQASVKPIDEVRSTVALAASWGLADVLYFADSLGDMDRSQVQEMVRLFREVWDGSIGIHTHDNRCRALDNTLAAVDAGAGWVDATVLGMGRGAGNCRTDLLLFELGQRGMHQYHAEALLEVTEVSFRDLQQRYGWGTNLLYFKSAVAKIHPTYVQLMQSDTRYEWAEMVGVLEALPELGSLSFSSQNIDIASSTHVADGDGDWDATDWLKGSDVLVLGSGPSVERHRAAIEAFVEEHGVKVLCLNSTPGIAADHIDAFVACHPTRLLLESHRLASLPRPLVAPRKVLDTMAHDVEVEVLDYGITVGSDEDFEVRARGCTVPDRLALTYALAVAQAGGARRILLVGVDGYPAGDARQEEVAEMLAAYQQQETSLPIVALTPTSYPIPQGSVYATTT